MNQVIKKLNDSLYIIEELLEDKMFGTLIEEFKATNNSWVFNKKEAGQYHNHPKFGNLLKQQYDAHGVGDILPLVEVAEVSKYTVMKVLKKRMKLERVNTNIQFAGQHSSLHEDGGKNQWTLCIFVAAKWNEDWGGAFQIFIDGEEFLTPFNPNRAVLFRADHAHKGYAPTHLCPDARLSAAFTYSDYDAMMNKTSPFVNI